jgi:hypothetical protein
MARRKQAMFAARGFDVYRRASRRARFLAQIDRIMPWNEGRIYGDKAYVGQKDARNLPWG